MSALEILVFGARAGRYVAEYSKTAEETEIDLDEPKPNCILPLDVKSEIRKIMGENILFKKRERVEGGPCRDRAD